MEKANNWFVFDDYAHLFKAKFYTFEQIFSIIPSAKYNDRPIGSTFIKIMFDSFSLNAVKFHLVLMLIHILNNDGIYFFIPIVSSAIFGIWPNSVMCVQWVAAIFALLGATLFLLTLNAYLSSKLNDKTKVFNLVLSTVFYILSLRTKEMTIVLPVIILIFQYINYSNEIVVFIVISILFFSTFATPVQIRRDYWLSIGKNNKTTIEDLSKISNINKDTNIYIEGINDNYNIFIYGPGFINTIIFNSKNITTYMSVDNIDTSKSYVRFSYDKGNLSVVDSIRTKEKTSIDIRPQKR